MDQGIVPMAKTKKTAHIPDAKVTNGSVQNMSGTLFLVLLNINAVTISPIAAT